MADRGDEEGPGSMEMAEVLDEEPLDEADEVEEIADLEEEVEYIEGGAEDDILDDIEDVEIDEIADTDTDDLVETAEIDEELEDVSDEEDAELDYVEDVEDVEEIIGDDISEEQAGESGPGDEDTLEGIGLGQDSGQEKTGIDIGGDETLSKDGGAGLEDGDKEDGEGVGHDMAGKGDEEGPGSMEMAEVLDDSELDTVEAVEDIEDLEDEVEYIEGSDAEAGDLTGTAEHRFEEEEGKRENEQLGLPVDSLGKEYSIEADSKIKKSKLLAEEFDGYLGSMDRHYNHYILIPEGEYLIGSKQPKKDEKPEQMVYLKPIYFSRFPITNGLFEIFVEKTGYKTTAEKVGYGTVYFGRFEKKKDEITGLITSTWNSSLYCKTVEGACWYQPSGPKSTLYNKRNHPVVQISMEDAMAFASWTGKRLPTENEWEAASRTVNGWIFPWGQEWKKDACNIEDSCTADTTPVDKYSEFENDFGIVDTIGNVLEWTDNSFEEMSKTNNGAKYRAVRGGSWISGNDIRLFSRFMIEPESHSNILGFRCVAY
jgi:formylglycine-generating enzyme required for sulfatase activity